MSCSAHDNVLEVDTCRPMALHQMSNPPLKDLFMQEFSAFRFS